ncbi:hypothetical protein L3V59_31500 [Burkholderia aenigmatica]|uniref:hypothetical protein n=1 Tax=Burkholderia TaxID=32008 RepID=UPI001CF40875|nr:MULTISPECIES: hypothetical protein [Burkholderia]MCA8297759.1 hypothetical protein [Burkholderia sp. AU30198]UKD14199.1 hypothetical protein L3V59_31500 [Burkholderia aenigmatica]
MKFSINPDAARYATIVSIVSAGISIVSAWFAHEAMKSNELVYRPYVVATQHFDDSENRRGIYLSNAGLGPAIIKDMTVTIGTRKYTGLGPSIWSRVQSDAGVGATGCFRTGWPRPDDPLKAGEIVPLLALSDKASPSCLPILLKLLAMNDIAIDIQYESVHGTAFSSTRDVGIHDPDATQIARQYDDIERRMADLIKGMDAMHAPHAASSAQP